MTDDQFRIRLIQQQDNPAVAGIIRTVMTEFGAVGEGYSIEDPEVDCMFEAYQHPGSAFYVIESGDEILGCAGFARLKDAPETVCELQKMYFLNSLRGQGLGGRMLRHCLDEAVRAGYHQCYLETLEHMDTARAVYRKFGFEPLDQPMGNTGHCACNRWMLLNLNQWAQSMNQEAG